MKTIFFTLIIFLMTPFTYVMAEESQPSDMNSPLLFIQLIFYLFIILLLIYLFFRLVAKKSGMINTSFYHHLGGIPLGQNKTVQLVEIGNKIYILGVGENVQLISIIDDEEDLDAITKSINSSYEQNNRLSSWLNRFSISNKFIPKKKKMNNSNQFEHVLTEKMEQLKDRRIHSVNQLLDESNEGTEKRDQHE